jgi:hypothetical protein
MRILLDAHISGRTVGKVLTEDGHDVRALEPELEPPSTYRQTILPFESCNYDRPYILRDRGREGSAASASPHRATSASTASGVISR